jgi:hypothetical protein
MSDHERIGKIETVVVNGRTFTGCVYHIRANGWACIETHDHVHCASGPAPRAAHA